MNETLALLKMLGGHRNELIFLVLLRLTTLGILSWLIGWSIGLALAQMAFRFVAYAFKGPFAVPMLIPVDMLHLLIWTMSATLAGEFLTLITSPRRLKGIEYD